MPIFHKVTDLDNVGDQGSAMRALAFSLLANAETRIVYRQEAAQLGATSPALGLAGTDESLIPTLGTGQGLWRIQHHSFVVQHQMHPDEPRGHGLDSQAMPSPSTSRPWGSPTAKLG